MGAVDLQWWQAALGLLTLTGLSAAPWIVALLRGALVPRSTMQTVLDAKQAQIDGIKAELDRSDTRRSEDVARALAERDHERDAVRIERQRSDDSAKALMQLSQEFGETMIHLAQGTSPTPAGAST